MMAGRPVRISILGDARDFTAATTRATNSLSSMAKKASAIGSTIGNLAGGAITSVVGSLGSLASQAIETSDATDKFKQTLNFAGLKSKAIDDVTKKVRTYADQTVYSLADVQNTTAQLAANGVKNYVGITEAAGNLNAVAGGNADTFKSVAMMLTQTAGAGKLTTENWNQLADAIPGASGQLQDALKKAGAYTGNFRDAMAKGQITSDEFNAALLKLGNKPIAKEAATSTSTFEGAIGNLQATINGGLADAFSSIKPAATKAIAAISNKFGEFIDFVKNTAVPKVKELYKEFKDKFGPAIASVGKTINDKVLPFVKDLFTQKIPDAFRWVADHKDLFEPLAVGILAIVAAVKVYQGAMALWQTATKVAAAVQAAFNVVMDANPIGIIVLAITGLVAGLVYFFTQTKTGQAVWKAFTDFLGRTVDAIKNFFTKTIPNAFQKVTDKAGEIKDAVVGKFNDLVSFVTGLPGKVSSAAGKIWNFLKDKAKAAVGSYSSGGGGVLGYVWNMVNFYRSLGSKINSAAGNLFHAITDKARSMAGSYRSGGGGVLGFVWNFVNFYRGLGSKIASAAGNLFGSIITKASSMVGSYSSGGGGVKGKLFSIVSFVKTLPGKITSATSGLWNGISDSFKSAINWVIDKWNGLSFTPPSFEAFGKKIGGFTVSTPDIPRLASGGITTGPTLALIGDNPGGKEAVIPLDKYNLGGETNINVTVVAPVGSSPAQIGKELQKYLDAYVRAGGRRVAS